MKGRLQLGQVMIIMEERKQHLWAPKGIVMMLPGVVVTTGMVMLGMTTVASE